jgi:hypothetical protein
MRISMPGRGGAEKNGPDAEKAGGLLGPGGGQLEEVPADQLDQDADHHAAKTEHGAHVEKAKQRFHGEQSSGNDFRKRKKE